MIRKFALSWVLLGFSSLAIAADLPVPEIDHLSNGLEIAWFVNDQLPVIDLALLVKSGYRDDPAGKSGTAELLAAAIDRGAAGMNAQQISLAIETLGASKSIVADEDTFSMGMHGLSPDGPVLLDLLGKMATQPSFPAQDVEREKARILERWTHMGDSSDMLAALAYQRVISSGTPYGRGNLLSSREFGSVTRDDVLKMYHEHFTPKNALLMVVGRVNRAEFKSRIEKAFGEWSGEAPKKKFLKFSDSRLVRSVPKGKREILIVDRPELSQAQVRMGFKAPPLKAPEHYSLTVGNALLGEYFNSRLNSVIRDQLGLTYGISSGFAYSKDASRFTVSSATRNESVGPMILKTIDILKGMKTGPISAEEVTTAKDYLVGGFPLSVATLGSVAARWLNGVIFDLGPSYLNEFVPKISAIQQTQVQEAMKKDMDLDAMVIVVAGDGAEIQKSLKAAGISSSSAWTIRRVGLKELL